MQNIKINEQSSSFPKTKHTLKYRRRLVISFCVSYVLNLATLILAGLPLIHQLEGWIETAFLACIYLVIVVCGICCAMLFASTRNIGQLKNIDLNDHQRMVRYRAYYLAYRIVAVSLIIALASSIFLSEFFGINLLSNTPSGVLLLGTLIFISTLPTLIIAWQESEI